MTKQYKNPFEDPEEKLWDQKIKDFKIPERKETPLEERAEEMGGYIYVPSIKLYVAKERSLLGKNWYQAHEELHKQGMQMLTIRQFIDFILYLKQNKLNIPEAERILGEILTPKEPYRFGGEWLDAKFSSEGAGSRGLHGMATWPAFVTSSTPFIKEADADYQGYAGAGTGPSTGPVDPFGKGIGRGFSKKAEEELYIHYNHRIENGKLVAKNIEPLEKCLMGDNLVVNCYFNLKDCNKQGLPTKIGNEIKYYTPEEDHVAAFWVDMDREEYREYVALDCGNYKAITSTSLGVRAARKEKNKTTVGGGTEVWA